MPLPNLLPATLIALIAGFILSSSSRAVKVEHLRFDIDGNRYANNFANEKAATAGYGNLKPGQKMPPGAVVVKDTFTVTTAGEVFPAAVFFMQKLTPGRRPATGDSRFVQVLPDGSYIGDTTGGSPEDVAFCFICHKAMAEVDFLFFLPDHYRK